MKYKNDHLFSVYVKSQKDNNSLTHTFEENVK